MPKTRALPEDSHYSKVVVNGETIIDLTADTVDAAHMLTGYKAHDKKGAPIVGTCNFDANTQDANAAAAEILTGKTAYVKGSKVTGSMPNNGGVEGTISDGMKLTKTLTDGSRTITTVLTDQENTEIARLVKVVSEDGKTISATMTLK